MYVYDLRGISKAWDPTPLQTRADHKTTVVSAVGVTGENPLPGRKDTPAKESPLTAVRVTADDKVDIFRGKIFFVIAPSHG